MEKQHISGLPSFCFQLKLTKLFAPFQEHLCSMDTFLLNKYFVRRVLVQKAFLGKLCNFLIHYLANLSSLPFHYQHYFLLVLLKVFIGLFNIHFIKDCKINSSILRNGVESVTSHFKHADYK